MKTEKVLNKIVDEENKRKRYVLELMDTEEMIR